LGRDFHPWTALFLDGTQLSSAAGVSTAAIVNRPLEQFTIHFGFNDVAVRLTDGQFKIGTHAQWVYHPRHVNTPPYQLLYNRRLTATMAGRRFNSRVVGYTLGYATNGQLRYLDLTPDGDFMWAASTNP
jgi:hypothetical protein